MTHLTPASCDLFNRPCFQFAQLKKYVPESIPQLKADYKIAWENWRAIILRVAALLGEPFAAPHIERWCNGWQVRAHFFAYFKYHEWQESAAILSVLLNRRRLTVSLDWHCYKAGISLTTTAGRKRLIAKPTPTTTSGTAATTNTPTTRALPTAANYHYATPPTTTASANTSSAPSSAASIAPHGLPTPSAPCNPFTKPAIPKDPPCKTPSSPSRRLTAVTPKASPRCAPSSPNTA